MKGSRWLYIAALVVVVLGGIYYFLREEPPYEKPQQEKTPERITFHGNTMTEERDGKKKWDLAAEKIEIENSTKRVFITKPKVTYYQADGSRLEFVSEQAVITGENRDLQFIGNVQAVSSAGGTFSCDETLWQGQTEQFTAQGHVKMTRDDTVATADRAEGDKKLDKVTLRGNAKIVKGGLSR